ncbi:hypothetical protein CH333_06290 [candidate division WOR-3 bacterium JGI_Cruoil_03_44_89]|uniref:SMP-30/Gluconolactonase/LRE-like region domain-containing protein n=1 Tax=candidate division WOR-3 bacterium JGI_Cruoil_03_44_89 TaxID=1973748 RepID=A0A235BSI6_UNCW3|nr:MAG: hypothetical protein CH333_06290 [candidate division WOR-3 bacterium JGI_Cruoil_03_44_89]
MKHCSVKTSSRLCSVFSTLLILVLSQNLAHAQDSNQIWVQRDDFTKEDLDLDGKVDSKPGMLGAAVITDVSTAKDTGDVIHTIPAPGYRCQGLTYDGTYLWVSDYQTDSIYKVSTVDGAVQSSFSAPGNYVEGLGWDGTYLWASDNGGGHPSQIGFIN